MPPSRRKKIHSGPLSNPLNSRTTKNVKQNSSILSVKAIAAAITKTIDTSPGDMPINMITDSEDGYSDAEMGGDPFSSPITMVSIPPPAHSPPQQSTTIEPRNTSTSSEKQTHCQSSQGINLYIHAIPPEKPIVPNGHKKSHNTNTPQTHRLSTTETNEYAAALLAWQNAGAQHLRRLPPRIAADSKAVMTRCAARVIAGLPILDELPMKLQNNYPAHKPSQAPNISITQQIDHPKSSGNTDSRTHTISYVSAVVDSKKIPDSTPRLRVKNLKSKNVKPDTRVIVRLPQNHPLRVMDTFLTRTKLCSLLPRSELIKDIRIVPSGIALVAPSQIEAEDLLAAS